MNYSLFQCNSCYKPVLHPAQRLNFFSDYSHMVPCPHCRTLDTHFVKPLGFCYTRHMLRASILWPQHAAPRATKLPSPLLPPGPAVRQLGPGQLSPSSQISQSASLFGAASYNPPIGAITPPKNVVHPPRNLVSPPRSRDNATTPRCEVSPDAMDLDLGLLWRELAGLRLDEFCRLQLTRTR